jgi:hypothetical protein
MKDPKNESRNLTESKSNVEFPGYPIYPSSEDLYNKEKEEADINPEDVTAHKSPNEDDFAGKMNEKGFQHNMSGEDLDIPGSEEDEKENNAGSEDEENNFYSLGGDDHENLDEDSGDNI